MPASTASLRKSSFQASGAMEVVSETKALSPKRMSLASLSAASRSGDRTPSDVKRLSNSSVVSRKPSMDIVMVKPDELDSDSSDSDAAAAAIPTATEVPVLRKNSNASSGRASATPVQSAKRGLRLLTTPASSDSLVCIVSVL